MTRTRRTSLPVTSRGAASRPLAMRSARRGLTMLELILALIITAFVAAAISGMLGAVTSGVTMRRDNRSLMLRAHAAQTRLGAYISSARCLLDADDTSFVVWLSDSRQSGTVHASEIRWIQFDAAAGTFDVLYVKFPQAWSQAAKDLMDEEFSSSADWDAVLASYENQGLIAQLALVDELNSASVIIRTAVGNARHVEFDLGFDVDDQTQIVRVASTIRLHQQPQS